MRARHHRFAIAAVVAAVVLVTACEPLHLTTPSGSGSVRYRDDVFTQVDKTADVTYGKAARISGSIQTLKLDVYQPRGDTVAKRPAIVWVHGGSFKSGSKTSSEIVDQATVFAKKGFVTVSIDYRLSKGCAPFTDECIRGIEMAYHDAQAAVRFLRAKAATYQIDANRIAIAGSSAGGITAYNVAFGSEKVGHSGNPGYSSKVSAAVSLSGASLTTTPDAGEPPTMDFHGDADQVVPLSWNDTTMADARKAKLIAERTVWKGDGHVPYAKHRQQILDETRNFLYAAMDLGHAQK
ncbi:carboxylesterase family protein [Aquihabitans daechungensis]|uniref:carboxylesterase family protein n=1 Tax=Aquihabitans daechungensis TaxID=1052257 RepID=UPI003B9F326C